MSKSSSLAAELTSITAQIDRLEGGAEICLDSGSGMKGRSFHDFHERVAVEVREHCVGLLKSARAHLLVEMANEMGIPAQLEESEVTAIVVEHPAAPGLPMLPNPETP